MSGKSAVPSLKAKSKLFVRFSVQSNWIFKVSDVFCLCIFSSSIVDCLLSDDVGR